jgi:hypothetical protein
MPTVKVTLPALHLGQLKIKAERERFNVICCGRRFGKNVLFQDLAVETALAHSLPCAWAAPTYKQLLDDWRVLADTLSAVIVRRNEQEKQMQLVGGGVLDFWSLDSADSIRGRKYARFIVNEAGMVPKLLDVFNLVIRPTLIDYQGDAYIGGTPKGMNGFWSLFNTLAAGWHRWLMSSYTNPHILASELDALKTAMTERAFQQEIMAQFLPDGGGVFRNVRAAVPEGLTEQPGRIPQHDYVIGVDWGRTGDATVFTVIDATLRAVAAWDRMTQTDFNLQLTRLRALWERFGKPPLLVEANSFGMPQLESLGRMGMNATGFQTTNATKAEIIDGLALAFERGDIKLLPDEMALMELSAYESERLPSGLIRYGAPDGLHDDYVISLALAWYAASQPEAAGEAVYAQPYTIGSSAY